MRPFLWLHPLSVYACLGGLKTTSAMQSAAFSSARLMICEYISVVVLTFAAPSTAVYVGACKEGYNVMVAIVLMQTAVYNNSII